MKQTYLLTYVFAIGISLCLTALLFEAIAYQVERTYNPPLIKTRSVP